MRTVAKKAEDCMLRLLRCLERKLHIPDLLSKLPALREERMCIKKLLPRMDPADERELQGFLACVACSLLTHDRCPVYHYGLSQKILTTATIMKDLEFIVQDHAMEVGRRRADMTVGLGDTLAVQAQKLFYCPGIDRLSVWGIHRAGWEYVLRHLWFYHAEDETLPIFDDYLDSTFNWMSDTLAAAGVIPYRRPWFGMMHHTANKNAGPNNLDNVFANPLFVQSLKKCRYLIAMSHNMVEQINRRLRQVGMPHVKVIEMVHPSETPSSIFGWNRFLANSKRMLVQIGCWYRDPYMLYTLDLPNKSWIRKAALRGRRMHNNFPPSELKINARSDDPPLDMGITLCGSQSVGDSGVLWKNAPILDPPSSEIMMCRPDGVRNMFVVSMLEELVRNFWSVKVLEHLSNDEYDRLLSENVVFLHMQDAGAINTLIECVMRNTPILINRLPAVEQVLGSEYPLFFDNATTAATLACSPEAIRAAHKHLLKINKNPYSIGYFLEKFVDTFKSHSV
jgi:hypothetical protein